MGILGNSNLPLFRATIIAMTSWAMAQASKLAGSQTQECISQQAGWAGGQEVSYTWCRWKCDPHLAGLIIERMDVDQFGCRVHLDPVLIDDSPRRMYQEPGCYHKAGLLCATHESHKRCMKHTHTHTHTHTHVLCTYVHTYIRAKSAGKNSVQIWQKSHPLSGCCAFGKKGVP